ncbi:hypothetical protein AIOL_001332 [Candidatus Rhodobacter oscarellae]|uniref:Flagellar motor switch protein FliN-like C-terminal domain-containing protein n=1 Tax=Candidatus Rhodobacter oscarellae TaxID=1675527 RepID=A0A0J9E0X7_9RHOB|nr:hypothetical protein AIOL_001332 [Candidatus Rhodobacter lobularis]
MALDFGLYVVHAGVSRDALAALTDMPPGECADMVGDDIICELLRVHLDTVLDEQFRQIPRTGLEIRRIDPPERYDLMLQYADNGSLYSIALIIPDEHLEMVRSIWNLVAPPRDGLRIPFVASLDLASCRVSFADLARAKPGDLIVIGAVPAPKQPYLNLRGRYWAPLKPTECGYALQQAPRRLPPPQMIEMPNMENTDPQDETRDAGLDQQSIDELPVMVEFSVGDIDIPVSELSQLTKGYVFNFELDPERSVRMRVNGRTIGYGEIITLGDGCGLRITERC